LAATWKPADQVDVYTEMVATHRESLEKSGKMNLYQAKILGKITEN